ncbi:MAG: O-antigen ligase family protein [Gaiellaceae bacterium]
MSALRHMALWPQLRSPRYALLLVTLGFSLVRARDQPGFDVSIGNTVATVVPGDLLLAALAVTSLVAFARRGLPREAWGAIAAAVAFCGIVIGTAAFNGTAAFVSAVKLVELAALGLGAVALVRSRPQVEALVDVLLLFTIAADIFGFAKFVAGGGGRQASFLGEHDFAALATLPLVYGLARAFERRPDARAWTAIVAGAAGCILGAALASLVGLYLGTIVLVVGASLRRRATLRAFAVTAVVVAAVSAATLFLRAGDLGFLQQWFGKPPSRPGQYAASWSQRLIYVYVGGRIFLAKPALGTGWYGDLPPKTFVAYLPDARDRFTDQPANYFPPPDSPFIPQQTWDQILYELGVIGGLAMLALLVALVRACRRAARRTRDLLADLPGVWVASSIGALAGEGFFGGTPLAATFWLVAGVAVAVPLISRRSS